MRKSTERIEEHYKYFTRILSIYYNHDITIGDLDVFTTYNLCDNDIRKLKRFKYYIYFCDYYVNKVRPILKEIEDEYYDTVEFSTDTRQDLIELMQCYEYLWVQQEGLPHPYYIEDIESVLYMLQGYAIPLSTNFKEILETLGIKIEIYDRSRGLVCAGKFIQSAISLDVVGIIENGTNITKEMKRMKVSKFRK